MEPLDNIKYPVTSRRAVIECPIHRVSVALDEHGRLASSCPECVREVTLAHARLACQQTERLVGGLGWNTSA